MAAKSLWLMTGKVVMVVAVLASLAVLVHYAVAGFLWILAETTRMLVGGEVVLFAGACISAAYYSTMVLRGWFWRTALGLRIQRTHMVVQWTFLAVCLFGLSIIVFLGSNPEPPGKTPSTGDGSTCTAANGCAVSAWSFEHELQVVSDTQKALTEVHLFTGSLSIASDGYATAFRDLMSSRENLYQTYLTLANKTLTGWVDTQQSIHDRDISKHSAHPADAWHQVMQKAGQLREAAKSCRNTIEKIYAPGGYEQVLQTTIRTIFESIQAELARRVGSDSNTVAKSSPSTILAAIDNNGLENAMGWLRHAIAGISSLYSSLGNDPCLDNGLASLAAVIGRVAKLSQNGVRILLEDDLEKVRNEVDKCPKITW